MFIFTSRFCSFHLFSDLVFNVFKNKTSNLASSSHAKMSEQARLVKQARYDLANILSFVFHFAAFLQIYRVSNA